VDTPAGPVKRVKTALDRSDRLGALKARWGIGRMRYRVEPGLYALGNPKPETPVLVSANYKLSFDTLRSRLQGRDAWILVLDTRGINVWCAAGKGTFGTEEVVRRVEAARLHEVVSHRRLVLPQLGAPGVAAHEVKERTGFRVVYGPVRAEDISAFLDAGMETTAGMRRVRFPLRDRLAVAPMELVASARYFLPLAAVFALLGALGLPFAGVSSAVALLAAWLGGAVLVPALLPWLPGRAFASKGVWAGAAIALGLAAWGLARPGFFGNGPTVLAWLFLVPAVVSFLGMNFTGASTYASLSGVRREMRIAVPLQVACAVAGLGLWVAGRFVGGGGA